MRQAERVRNPGCVNASSSSGGVVLFELPTKHAAERLLSHLGSLRWAWLEHGDGFSVVGAMLYPDPGDLAVLLRTVQAWVDGSWLTAIRFEVDGRTYVLEARQPALAAS
jgi:hypothetical protein